MNSNVNSVKDLEDKLIAILGGMFNNYERDKSQSNDYLQDKINNLKLQKREYFENYKLNLISKDEFINFKNIIDLKIEGIEIIISDSQFKDINKIGSNVLTKKFLTKSIDYILVNSNEILEVKLKDNLT